jgi:hypothetical protein
MKSKPPTPHTAVPDIRPSLSGTQSPRHPAFAASCIGQRWGASNAATPKLLYLLAVLRCCCCAAAAAAEERQRILALVPSCPSLHDYITYLNVGIEPVRVEKKCVAWHMHYLGA